MASLQQSQSQSQIEMKAKIQEKVQRTLGVCGTIVNDYKKKHGELLQVYYVLVKLISMWRVTIQDITIVNSFLEMIENIDIDISAFMSREEIDRLKCVQERLMKDVEKINAEVDGVFFSASNPILEKLPEDLKNNWTNANSPDEKEKMLKAVAKRLGIAMADETSLLTAKELAILEGFDGRTRKLHGPDFINAGNLDVLQAMRHVFQEVNITPLLKVLYPKQAGKKLFAFDDDEMSLQVFHKMRGYIEELTKQTPINAPLFGDTLQFESNGDFKVVGKSDKEKQKFEEIQKIFKQYQSYFDFTGSDRDFHIHYTRHFELCAEITQVFEIDYRVEHLLILIPIFFTTPGSPFTLVLYKNNVREAGELLRYLFCEMPEIKVKQLLDAYVPFASFGQVQAILRYIFCIPASINTFTKEGITPYVELIQSEDNFPQGIDAQRQMRPVPAVIETTTLQILDVVYGLPTHEDMLNIVTKFIRYGVEHVIRRQQKIFEENTLETAEQLIKRKKFDKDHEMQAHQIIASRGLALKRLLEKKFLDTNYDELSAFVLKICNPHILGRIMRYINLICNIVLLHHDYNQFVELVVQQKDIITIEIITQQNEEELEEYEEENNKKNDDLFLTNFQYCVYRLIEILNMSGKRENISEMSHDQITQHITEQIKAQFVALDAPLFMINYLPKPTKEPEALIGGQRRRHTRKLTRPRF